MYSTTRPLMLLATLWHRIYIIVFVLSLVFQEDLRLMEQNSATAALARLVEHVRRTRTAVGSIPTGGCLVWGMVLIQTAGRPRMALPSDPRWHHGVRQQGAGPVTAQRPLCPPQGPARVMPGDASVQCHANFAGCLLGSRQPDMTPAGPEPAVPGPVGQCRIHLATTPAGSGEVPAQ
jgi:hypothetical protein